MTDKLIVKVSPGVSNKVAVTSPTGDRVVVSESSTPPAFLDKANAAYNQSNTALIQSNVAILSVNTAIDQANAAILQANIATSQVAAASDLVNTAYAHANAAYAAANNAVTDYSPAFNKANVAYDHANAAYNYANTIGTGANSYTVTVGSAANSFSIGIGAASNTWANTVGVISRDYANASFYTIANGASAFNQANAAYAAANNAVTDYSPAFNKANSAYDQANAAYNYANTIGAGANSYTNEVGLAANGLSVAIGAASNGYINTLSTIDRAIANGAANAANAFSITIGAASNSWANVIFVSANNAYNQANTARDQANAAYDKANNTTVDLTPANNWANTVGIASTDYANASFYTIANGIAAFNYANIAFAQANAAYNAANAASGSAAAFNQANTAYDAANTAFTHANDTANAANDWANTKLANSTGTFAGDLTISGNNLTVVNPNGSSNVIVYSRQLDSGNTIYASIDSNYNFYCSLAQITDQSPWPPNSVDSARNDLWATITTDGPNYTGNIISFTGKVGNTAFTTNSVVGFVSANSRLANLSAYIYVSSMANDSPIHIWTTGFYSTSGDIFLGNVVQKDSLGGSASFIFAPIMNIGPKFFGERRTKLIISSNNVVMMDFTSQSQSYAASTITAKVPTIIDTGNTSTAHTGFFVNQVWNNPTGTYNGIYALIRPIQHSSSSKAIKIYNMIRGEVFGIDPYGQINFGYFGQSYLSSNTAATIQLGQLDGALAPVAQTLRAQSASGILNTAGADLKIQGSAGTGTGTGGSVLIQVAPAQTSASTKNPYSTALSIYGNTTVAVTSSLIIGSLNVAPSIAAGNSYVIEVGAASNNWANTVGIASRDYANASFYTIANGATAFDYANVAFAQANTAYNAANTAFTHANDTANAANDYAVAIGAVANDWANTVGIASRNYANASFYTLANGIASFNFSNTAYAHANAAYAAANAAGGGSSAAAFDQANTAYNIANLAFDTANAAGGGVIINSRTVTTNSSIISTDTYILADGYLLLTLPGTETVNNKIIYVKNINTGTITITGNTPGELIDGYSNITILFKNSSLGFFNPVGSNNWLLY